MLAGKTIAGPHVRNACRRHLDDLVAGKERGLQFDGDAAARAIRFFTAVLCLAAGEFEGRPFDPLPWQRFIVGSIFGWKQADGRRRFRLAYIETAKGSGKTPLAAGIGHYGLLADNEPRAEVYAAASKKDQAMVLFRAAVAMRDQSPALAKRLRPSGANPVWQLTDLTTMSFFKPISSEDGQSGPLPHISLVDELHEHKDRTVLSMLRKGAKNRRNALTLIITNSGSDRKSVCWEEHERAVRVAAGTRAPDDDFAYVGEPLDDEVFAYVCGLDKGDEPLDDERCWIKANPSLDEVLGRSYVRTQVNDARAIPGNLNETLRLNFCVWTDAETTWMSRAALEKVLADFDPAEHVGKRVWVGLDLSATSDLTALAVVVQTGTKAVERVDKDGEVQTSSEPTFDAWVEAWTPAETMRERALKDRAPYDAWHREGWLRATPGPKIKLVFVAARLVEIDGEYRIEAAAYDRYAFRKFEEEVEDLGAEIRFVEHPQGGKRRAKPSDEQIEAAESNGEERPDGLWMPGSVNELETLILEQRIRIRRSPVTISAIMSAVLERDPFDNRWLSKRKATNRIDPAVALAMAVGAAMQITPLAKPSFADVLGSIAMVDIGA